MGGGSIKKPTQKRSINFTTETLETLDKLAAKNHTTTSELVRGYVEKGLSIEGSREDIDFIARIIRQEITAVYHVDEIKAIADHDTDRLAKLLMKIGKINGAIFFLLIKVLMNLANEGSEDDFDQMLSEAVKEWESGWRSKWKKQMQRKGKERKIGNGRKAVKTVSNIL